MKKYWILIIAFSFILSLTACNMKNSAADENGWLYDRDEILRAVSEVETAMMEESEKFTENTDYIDEQVPAKRTFSFDGKSIDLIYQESHRGIIDDPNSDYKKIYTAYDTYIEEGTENIYSFFSCTNVLCHIIFCENIFSGEEFERGGIIESKAWENGREAAVEKALAFLRKIYDPVLINDYVLDSCKPDYNGHAYLLNFMRIRYVQGYGIYDNIPVLIKGNSDVIYYYAPNIGYAEYFYNKCMALPEIDKEKTYTAMLCQLADLDIENYTIHGPGFMEDDTGKYFAEYRIDYTFYDDSPKELDIEPTEIETSHTIYQPIFFKE
ncbi:MAG: hypothetical protein FWE80_04365 [Oscillospiraceae bacterium]|nr:hypothetical protein [Oscillospiraceae bacterium]